MLPSVSIQKVDGGTGVVRPSDKGVLAIIATAQQGPVNTAVSYLNTTQPVSDYGTGKLVEANAYVMPEAGNPTILVRGTATTPGAYGMITQTGTGTSVASGDGSVLPLDDYNVLITVTLGGVVGTGPISYTYSLDGGETTSAVQSLGTAVFIAIPNTGIKVDLTHSASNTLVTGDTIAFLATGPQNTNADVVNALAGLAMTQSPFEMILIDGIADATTVSDVDTWLAGQELVGRFKGAIMTARPRHTDGSETEAQYKTFLQGLFESSSSPRICVCADVGDVSSTIPNRPTTGITQQRAVGWAVAARCMKIPYGTDPAEVDLGPVPQFAIDINGNPNHHDEFFNPGLDDLRLTTLRSFDGLQGSYITNANLLSPTGSDFVYVQNLRTINRACEIAFAILIQQLSRGVDKNPKVGPNGARYIAEGAALRIEGLVNAAIQRELAGQVSDLVFSLSRTDDISSNQGATLTGQMQLVSLAYIKQFAVTAGFVKAITQ